MAEVLARRLFDYQIPNAQVRRVFKLCDEAKGVLARGAAQNGREIAG
jgi:hypothetical protein